MMPHTHSHLYIYLSLPSTHLHALVLFSLPACTLPSLFSSLPPSFVNLQSNWMQFRSLARFCFFNKQISEKYGQKCCRYNQNGVPLALPKVNETFSSLKDFLVGWKVREDGRKLVRHFYVEDYPLALKYLEEVVKIDANEFKQCPTYKVENGELLTLELYSITLKGLSMVDFQFALRINNIPYHKFSMFHIENEQDYRLEASMVRMERQAKDIDRQLEEDKKNWKQPA